MLDVDEGRIVKLYNEGWSTHALAAEFKVSRNVIVNRLNRAKVQRRNRSQALRLRLSKMTPAQRKALVAKANKAIKGKKQTLQHKCNKAMRLELHPPKASKGEAFLMGMLEAAGIKYIRQRAIGPYNVDVVIPESCLALEVFGGYWHTTKVKTRNYRRRTDYLIHTGWLPIIIWDIIENPLGEGALYYIKAVHEARLKERQNDTGVEHVIYGNGARLLDYDPMTGFKTYGKTQDKLRALEAWMFPSKYQ